MQTRFLLAHPSFIVLKGLSAVISSLDFLASIRFCSTDAELRAMLAEEDDDIVIAAQSMAAGISVPAGAQLLVLDHGLKTDDMFTEIDEAISHHDKIDAFLNQEVNDPAPISATLESMGKVADMQIPPEEAGFAGPGAPHKFDAPAAANALVDQADWDE